MLLFALIPILLGFLVFVSVLRFLVGVSVPLLLVLRLLLVSRGVGTGEVGAVRVALVIVPGVLLVLRGLVVGVLLVIVRRLLRVVRVVRGFVKFLLGDDAAANQGNVRSMGSCNR